MDLEQRTHNPLVLGSNPSGPTNQPIDDAVVQKVGAIGYGASIGQLKLFSQLFKPAVPLSRRYCCSDKYMPVSRPAGGQKGKRSIAQMILTSVYPGKSCDAAVPGSGDQKRTGSSLGSTLIVISPGERFR